MDKSEYYHNREQELIAILCTGNPQPSPLPNTPALSHLYWQSPSFAFASPACGLGKIDLYNVYQRVAILQFSLFNWVTTEGRTRFFPRRTDVLNLQSSHGYAPSSRGHLLPHHASQGQIYDLIPALKEKQLGSRCERPHSAISAAAANRARREAEFQTHQVNETQALLDSLRPTIQIDYNSTPLRFNIPGPKVPLGSRSAADDPTPGSRTGRGAAASVSATGMVLEDVDTTNTCNCGRTRPCFRPGCRRSPTLTAKGQSVLGDPGDWFCDFCGLCNWTRRVFCLRCCPLETENVCEAIQKGIIHPSDPILDILNLESKTAQALKKQNWNNCACFGPHHGSRCPHANVGVPANLWGMYLGPQREVLGDMRG